MPKINILYCIEYLAYGGTEKQLMTLINGINSKIFVPHLCCLRKSEIGLPRMKDALALFKAMKRNKIQLDFKSFGCFSSILQVVKLAKYISKYRIDVIVSYFIDPTIMSFFAAKLSFAKLVMVICLRDMGLLRSDQHNLLMRCIYRHTSHFIANSEAVKLDYVKFDGIPKNRISVIYNGVDMTKFDTIQRTEKRPTVIGIVANLNRRVKRVDIFLRAAAYICAKRADVSFMVIGEGELKRELVSLASRFGIEKRVNFVGRVFNIEEYLSQIHIGVNTSESEGFPNAILEYLSSGIPVVATDTGGNREIIVDSENGFLFPINDYRTLGDKLLLMLDDNMLYSKLCANSKKCMEGCFGTSIMVKNYERFFTHAIFRANYPDFR